VIKALCFDVIGTLADWHGTIADGLAAIGYRGDRDEFATRWAQFYAGGEIKTERQIADEGLRLLGELHPSILSDATKVYQFTNLWVHLKIFPDVLPAFARLLQLDRYRLVPLSNVTAPMMRRLSTFAGLTWDCVLSAEAVGVKKPDARVYRYAIEQLRCKPHEVLMVAAHRFDLHGAQAEGLRTAYVQRRDDRPPGPDESFDYVVADLNELAEKLIC
jgi:2-haloacid dehalogenase